MSVRAGSNMAECSMTGFKIDRSALPKAWEHPLLFDLTNGRAMVTVEIQQDAALEYKWAWNAPGIALLVAPERIENFLLAVEAAVDRGMMAAPASQITLRYNDLYP